MRFSKLAPAVVAVFIAASFAHAVPAVVNYQGRLTDNSPQQNPVDATVTIDFSIWDAASGGSSLWSETQSVQVVKGLFSVLLGSTTAMPPSLFSGGDVRYLEIHVSGETLTPRQRIATAPFASVAAKADDAQALGGVGASAYQQRIGTPCPAGYAINAVAADGTATCIQSPPGPPGPPGPAGNGLDSGSITGTVVTCGGPASDVLVYAPGHSAVSYSATDGSYALDYLPAGTYTVQYKSPAGAFTTNGIVVSAGQATPQGPKNVANLVTDASNCGSCGHACSLSHATAVCTGGACAVGSCNSGFGNCNADSSDGCETDLTASIQNCNTCGNVCSSNHMTPACHASGCGGTCDPGWSSCDGTFANGCETNTDSNNANCGGCNFVCTAGKSCVNGSCV